MSTQIRAARAAIWTLSTLINLASIAVALGAGAMIYSQSLLTGLLVALAALISGIIGFGYSAWRMQKVGGNNAGMTAGSAA